MMLDERRTMQVVKQLFDVGALFDHADDLAAVRETYNRLFIAENGYRGNRFSRMQALDDTIAIASVLCRKDLKGAPAEDHALADLLQLGIRQVASHLAGARFSVSDAKIAAAKAACLAAVLKTDKDMPFASLRYSQTAGFGAITLGDPVLQRLRGGNPEAFHYWWKTEACQG